MAVGVDVLKIRVPPNPLGRAELQQSLIAADRKTFPPLRATALEDQSSIFRAHPHQESVRLLAVAGIRLERALAFHGSLRRA